MSLAAGVRNEEVLLNAAISFEEMWLQRQDALAATIRREKGPTASSWSNTSCVPFVFYEHERLYEKSTKIPMPRQAPTRIADEGTPNSRFLVQSEKGTHNWVTEPMALQQGDFLKACSCGGCSSSRVACKHFKRVLRACNADYRSFTKRWQTPEAWEAQVGQKVTPVDFMEICDNTLTLHR